MTLNAVCIVRESAAMDKEVRAVERKFQTIRQTAKLGILSEYNLRLRLAQGKLPGVYSGNRFLVNIPMLIEKLNDESEESYGVHQ